jgi:hypothetical protein
VRNDDCQTPLGVARTKGHANVVRVIEVCLTNLEIRTTQKVLYLYLYSLAWSKFYFSFLLFRIMFATSLAGCGNIMVQAFLKH